jgi:hypothetical protein
LSQLSQYTSQFAAISLEETARVNLLDRRDTKYVIPLSKIPQIFENLGNQYKVLNIGEFSYFNYRNIYYDTPDYLMHQQHHNGFYDRFKIRLREYTNTGLTFAEVKRKNNLGRTIKSRITIEDKETLLTPEGKELISRSTPFDPNNVFPVLNINFDRITFIQKDFKDRATVDFNLVFSHKEISKELGPLVIAEVKQNKLSTDSDFIRAVTKAGVKPMRFSKYCIGMTKIYPNLKNNLFKPKLHRINKLIHGIPA